MTICGSPFATTFSDKNVVESDGYRVGESAKHTRSLMLPSAAFAFYALCACGMNEKSSKRKCKCSASLTSNGCVHDIRSLV